MTDHPTHTPERSTDRDAGIEAMLPLVGFGGWTVKTLREAAGENADLLFPGGPADMVEAFCDLADRRMEEAAAQLDLAAMRVPQRVRAVIALRLEQNRPHKDAVRRALGLLALPGHLGLTTRTAARTVDAIWHAAGDRSADFSWYTKRALLAPVYGAALLAWMRDDSEDDATTLRVLDRGLATVGAIGRLRARIERLRPGFARTNPA